MSLQFYNSLTNQIESFESIDPGVVRMYSCGTTVYDFAHIGNFRSFLFGD
jgi:cysteinyl-tRNA synthetase